MSDEMDSMNDPSKNSLPGNIYNDGSWMNNNSCDSHDLDKHPSSSDGDLTILGIALFFGACIAWKMIF